MGYIHVQKRLETLPKENLNIQEGKVSSLYVPQKRNDQVYQC